MLKKERSIGERREKKKRREKAGALPGCQTLTSLPRPSAAPFSPGILLISTSILAAFTIHSLDGLRHVQLPSLFISFCFLRLHSYGVFVNVVRRSEAQSRRHELRRRGLSARDSFSRLCQSFFPLRISSLPRFGKRRSQPEEQHYAVGNVRSTGWRLRRPKWRKLLCCAHDGEDGL